MSRCTAPSTYQADGAVSSRERQPNRHDVLTGSQPEGTAFGGDQDRTCKNSTSSTQGSAAVTIPTALA
jgi:hypothetical protein